MDTTITYGLPYPTDDDPLRDAVKTIPAALAAQVESTIAGLAGVPAPGAWATPPDAVLPPVAGVQSAQARKIGTTVRLRGVAAYAGGGSSGAVLAVFSPGMRPPSTERLYAYSSFGGIVRLDVLPNGQLILRQAIAEGTELSFTSLSFDVD